MSLINKIYILLLVFILVACEESAPVHAESSAVESGQLPESGGVVQAPATAESSPTPTAAEQIEHQLGTLVPAVRATSMEDAVHRAAKIAQPGDTVLLSPACASFDMFSSYAQRGDIFQQAVWGLRDMHHDCC